jgi:hypothetical protein
VTTPLGSVLENEAFTQSPLSMTTPSSVTAERKMMRPSIRSGSIDFIRRSRQRSDREVLVGTPVKEGHMNYMLMYDMLTGIRVSVRN